MRLIAAAKTDVGRQRPQNQDSILVDDEVGLYAVCDGMGGHAAGEIASQTAVRTIKERVRVRLPSLAAIDVPERRAAALAELMRDAVERANARIHAYGDSHPEAHGAGTTCTVLLVDGTLGVLAHVGDSRLYLVRDGAIHQLSNDHTFIAEALRRGLSREQVAHFGPNMLSRAVGPHEHVDIDTLTFDLLPGDKLLLCTDGLHGHFGEAAELLEYLKETEAAAEALVGVANERGGDDNISVIAIEVGSGEEAHHEESERMSVVTQNLAALGGIELLRELSYAEVLELNAVLRTEEHDANAIVLREGESSAALYIIAWGEVQVERGGKRLTRLGAGSHFGEMALLTARPRSATVRALEPCRLLVLTRDCLYPLFQNNPVIAVKFLWNLAVRQSLRLDETTEWLSAGGDIAPDTMVDSHTMSSPFTPAGGMPALGITQRVNPHKDG